MSNRLVVKALETWQETRSDDKKLMLAVWYLQDNDFLSDFKEFFKHEALSPETITRTRRKLQEQGKYLATEEVTEHRYQQFIDARHTNGATITDGAS